MKNWVDYAVDAKTPPQQEVPSIISDVSLIHSSRAREHEDPLRRRSPLPVHFPCRAHVAPAASSGSVIDTCSSPRCVSIPGRTDVEDATIRAATPGPPRGSGNIRGPALCPAPRLIPIYGPAPNVAASIGFHSNGTVSSVCPKLRTHGSLIAELGANASARQSRRGNDIVARLCGMT